MTEEQKKVLAKALKEKLESMKLHPPKYNPELALTLESFMNLKIN